MTVCSSLINKEKLLYVHVKMYSFALLKLIETFLISIYNQTVSN